MLFGTSQWEQEQLYSVVQVVEIVYMTNMASFIVSYEMSTKNETVLSFHYVWEGEPPHLVSLSAGWLLGMLSLTVGI